MEDEKITIYGELYSTKNSKRILRAGNKIFIGKSAVSKSADKYIEQQLILHKQKWKSLCSNKKYPLSLAFTLYRKTKRHFDWVNIVQGLLDCMVRCEWLPDDDMEHLTPVFEKWEVDAKNPRVEIKIVNK